METAYVFGTRDLFYKSVDEKCDEKIDKFTKINLFTSDTQCSENISINISDFHSRFSGKLDGDIVDAIESHISSNCNAQESEEARQHAYDFIQYILHKSQEIEPRLKMKIVESGSFFSNVRVGMPFEFDFMLDITSTFSDGDSVLDYGYSVEKILDPKKSCSNIDTFLYRIHLKQNNGIFKNTQNYLNSTDVKDLICGLFQRVIENGECKTLWKIHHYSNTGTTWGPAFQLSLFFKNTAILIDLVPCLKFPASDTRTELPPLQYTSELLLKTLLSKDQLVTYLQNLPEKLFLVCKPNLFRLSTSQIEKDIFLNHLDQKLLQALKIAKYYFQIFFIHYDATNVDTFGNYRQYFQIFHNSHPFSSKSYVSSYMITNLFLHFLKLGMCFPSENSDKSAFLKNIVIMFLNFVYDVIGHRMPLAISRKNRWNQFTINIHGWCFCCTNTISVTFQDTMHSYFRHSMAEYITVLQNILSLVELDRFPLIGRRLEFCCVKCFDKNMLWEMVQNFIRFDMRRGLCELHNWTHQKELLMLPNYLPGDEPDWS